MRRAIHPAIAAALERVRATHGHEPDLHLYHRVMVRFGNRARLAQARDRAGARLYFELERWAREALRAASEDPELSMRARLYIYGPHAPRTFALADLAGTTSRTGDR